MIYGRSDPNTHVVVGLKREKLLTMLLIIEQQQLEARVHGSHSDAPEVPEVPAAAEGDSLTFGALKTTTTSVCFRRLNLNN